MNIYNTQQLLFDKTQVIVRHKDKKLSVPSEFYSKGFVLLNNITSAQDAQETAEIFLANIDTTNLSLLARIQNRIQLAKADAIPICDDSVETSFQALHFDMGQAIMSNTSQLMITAIALYHPFDTPASGAKTRILPLQALFTDIKWGNIQQLEQKLLDYVKAHGDGWDDTNTHRLQCFARFVDAASGTSELAHYRDKTMAQWFKDENNPDGLHSLANERLFYQMRGIEVDKKEHLVDLLPGQMLILDNVRVAHGRIGKRNAKEIYQFMFGLEATPTDIELFRYELLQELTIR